MASKFLIRSRHGTTFLFRRRVPDDLIPLVGKRYLVRGLSTGQRSEAIIAARRYAAQTDAVFYRLRKMKPKIDDDQFQVGLIVEVELGLLGQPSRIKVDAKPEEEAMAHRLIASALAAPPTLTPTPAQPVTPQPVVDAATLFDDFIREKTAAGDWKDPVIARDHDYAPIWKNFAVHAQGHGLSAAACEAYRAETLANTALSPRTKERNLTRVAAVLRHGKRRFRLNQELAEILKFSAGKNVEDKSYLPFDESDLQKLFESPQYLDNTFKKASQFWLPLLGLYTGARIEELAGLHLAAFANVGDVPVVELSSLDTTDGGKNKHATRQFPLHPELIKAGLLDYVDMLRQENHIRLFPDLGEAERDGFGKRASTDFTDYRRGVGVGEAEKRSRKVFHSFRSTLSGMLWHVGMDGTTSRRLTGHAPLDVHEGTYLKFIKTPVALAYESIKKIDYGLSLPRFTDTAAFQMARGRKQRLKKERLLD